ncbi:MAG TPA: site-2 protease family protein [bacterium]
MALDQSHVIQAFIQLGILIFSLSLHEFGHAYVANRLGDPTAKMLGRLTINPIAHADPIGTILFPLIRFLYPGVLLFGWAKPVPVSPENFQNPRRDGALVAAAGPTVNVLIALVSLIALFILGQTQFFGLNEANQNILWDFFKFFFWLNFALAVFNLIPIYPLDGSWIIKALLPGPLSYQYSRMDRWGIWILIAGLYFGFLDYFFQPAIKGLVFVLNLAGLDHLTAML